MSYKPVTLYTSGVFNPCAFWTGNIFENIEGYAPLACAEFRGGATA